MSYKILHVLDHSIPLHSGYTFRTRNILQQQRARGWQTVHLTSAKQGETNSPYQEVDDLGFYRTQPIQPWYSKLPLGDQWAVVSGLKQRLAEVIEQEQPDVIHAHSPSLNGIAAVQVAPRFNIPVVYEIRAFWEDAAVDHGSCKEGDFRYRMTRALENYVLKRADHVTCICEGLKNDLLSRHILSANQLTVIPNAVNVEDFSVIEQKDQALLQQLGLQDCKVLGFLGSFYAYEGLKLLLDAAAQLIKQDPSYKVLLVGGGFQAENLQQQVKALGLTDHVVFTGRVPHADISRYYSLVDLLVFPRLSMRLTELVTPLKPLEAMAQGRVVLASDVGGHHELIEDGKTGFLFKAGDVADLVRKVQQVFAPETELSEVIANGRHFVEQVRNWPNSVANYQAIYDRLVKG